MSWRLEELLDPSHPTSKLWRRMRDERRAAVISQSHQKLLIPAPKHSDVEEARLFGGKLSTPSIINRQHLFRVDNYPVQLTIFCCEPYIFRLYSLINLRQSTFTLSHNGCAHCQCFVELSSWRCCWLYSYRWDRFVLLYNVCWACVAYGRYTGVVRSEEHT